MTERCAECRFWDQIKSDDRNGRCKRYAPRPSMYGLMVRIDDSQFRPCWPEIDDNEWCGEFKQK